MPLRLPAAPPGVAGREAGRPWKLATADACRWLPALSPGSADPRRCLAGPRGAWPGVEGQAARCRLDRGSAGGAGPGAGRRPGGRWLEDQRWALVRVLDPIGREFGL